MCELSKILDKDKFVLVSIEGATQEEIDNIANQLCKKRKSTRSVGVFIVNKIWLHYKSNIKDFNVDNFIQWCKDKGVISK